MRLDPRGLFKSGRRPTIAALPLVVAALGVLALLAPLGAAEEPLTRVGVLLAVAGGLEVLHGVRRATPSAMRRAVTSGVITCLMALLVIGAPFIASTALVLFLAISFAADAIGYAGAAWRSKPGAGWRLSALAALGDATVAVLLLTTRHISVTWLVAVGGALRMFGIAWAMATAKIHRTADAGRTLVDDLGLGDNPEAAAMSEAIAASEIASAPGTRRWTIAFIVTLFAIHLARMNPDRTLLGLLSPAIAVTGDMVLAVLFSLVILVPTAVSFRSSTRWLERIVWRRYLAGDGRGRGWRHWIASTWLRHRLRVGMRLREARFSVPVALGRGLVTGLPIAAVIAATVPVWGMSWFFDTENWASGVWNSWAEARTDLWREAMVRAIAGNESGTASTFAVAPPGTATGDFAFIVIGDTGEGDASQHVLRDQLLEVAWREDVRFVVISSDVVYPNGSMTDYEAKFWLPFKGVRKPVYAIPGNHDWYDALEAFAATFFEADAASAAMHARVNADLRMTQQHRLQDQRPDRRGRAPARRVPGANRPSARTVLRGAIRALRARRDRHGCREEDRSGATGVARIGARAGARQAHHGGRRPPLLRGRARRDNRQRGIREPQAPAARPRRHDHDGRRHPRFRVLRRPAVSRRSGRALLRQRRRRRVSELRHRAAMAGQPADRRVGDLSGSAGRVAETRSADTLVETARLVVDEPV